MSLYRYFKPSGKVKDDSNSMAILPSPEGPLSKVVPSSTIVAGDTRGDRSRGTYEKYTPTEEAKIANYAILDGTAAALRHFSKEYPRLKWSTVNDWKVATIKMVREGGVDDIKVTEINSKKRGRPSYLNDQLKEELKAYITALRAGGGVVNSSIVISAATGILMEKSPSSLEYNGGHLFLKKGWAKCFPKQMNFVKRKATTKAKVSIDNLMS